jgi:phage repressor protein C with HTH and peptisase S24 domain
MDAGENSPIYDDLMRFKPEGLTPNAWAVLAGVSRTVWADMRRHGNPSRRTLEKLLVAAGSSLAEFEALRVGATSSRQALASAAVADRGAGPWAEPQLPPLPVLASAPAGEWRDAADLIQIRSGEIVDRVARPATLATDERAYAIAVVGDSMWPRFRPGRRLAISPNAAVAAGDDVLVKIRCPTGGDATTGLTVRALIKELVRSSVTGVELRQFNPDVTFSVPSDEIAAIEKVIGELI